MKDGMALFCVREFDLSRPEKLEMEFKNFNRRQKKHRKLISSQICNTIKSSQKEP